MRSKVCLESTNGKTETDHINYLQLGISLHLALNDFKRACYKCTNLFCPKPEGSSTSPELHLRQVSESLIHPKFRVVFLQLVLLWEKCQKFQLKKRKNKIT